MFTKTFKIKGGESKVIFSDDRKIAVVLTFSWVAHGDTAFRGNYNPSSPNVELYYEVARDDGSDRSDRHMVLKAGPYEMHKVRRRAEADKVAREYIRENNLRRRHKELAKELIGEG